MAQHSDLTVRVERGAWDGTATEQALHGGRLLCAVIVWIGPVQSTRA